MNRTHCIRLTVHPQTGIITLADGTVVAKPSAHNTPNVHRWDLEHLLEAEYQATTGSLPQWRSGQER